MPFVVSSRGRRFMDRDGFTSQFRDRIAVNEAEATKTANEVSRVTFQEHLSRRPLAPARPDRPTTSGEFASFIEWARDGKGAIAISRTELEAKAEYALIQEIGTGQSARITNPPGSVSVKSQIGRRLPMSLAWANGPGGPPSRGSNGIGSQQLFVLDGMQPDENGEPFMKRRTGRIGRQIKGKHYLRDGGLAGFDVLRTRMFADAKKSFS